MSTPPVQIINASASPLGPVASYTVPLLDLAQFLYDINIKSAGELGFNIAVVHAYNVNASYIKEATP